MRPQAKASIAVRVSAVAKRKNSDGRRNNRPPVSGQFKPGKSGHPAGRQKGTRNARTELHDQLNRTIAVTENGKRVRKKKWAVIIAQQINKAMGGDLKAAQFIEEQMAKYGLLVEGDNEPAKLTTDEGFVFEDFLRRVRATDADPEPANSKISDNLVKPPPSDEGRNP